MKNLILQNREELSKYHYITKADIGSHNWFNFYSNKLEKYLHKSEGLCLVVVCDPDKESDFYCLPFERISDMLKKDTLVADAHGKKTRWVGNIRDHKLSITGCSNDLDISQYYGNSQPLGALTSKPNESNPNNDHMFTWIPIHEEAASKLLTYRQRQSELVAVLRDMRDAGLTTMSITDQDATGKQFDFTEIDPFTFLANFNRGLTFENRRALWQLLKDAWSLQAPVPTDFQGIPVVNNQRCWLIPQSHLRPAEQIPALWDMFENMMAAKAHTDLDAELFDRCLGFPCVARGLLTMGFFWCRPSFWIAADRKNREFAKTKGIDLDPKSGAGYLEWLSRITATGASPSDFSRQAHEWSVGAASEYLLTDAQQEMLRERFAAKFPDFRDFEHPGSGFAGQELDYKHKGLAKWQEKMGFERAGEVLDRGEGLEVLKALRASVGALNIANFRTWEQTFGTTDEEATAVLLACHRAAAALETGPGTLAPIFEAISARGLRPTWDAISATLWAFNPDRFFPIKVSYYRKLADELGWKLPSGAPNSQKYARMVQFGEPFKDLVEPWEPHDWTDIQSFIWAITNREEGKEGPDTNSEFGWPFDAFFKDMDDANRKLDHMMRVVKQLQAGESTRDPRLVANYRPSNSRIRVLFGNWAVFSYREDDKCELLLPADHAKFADTVKSFTFQEPIDGVNYALGWFDSKVLEDEGLWADLDLALAAVRNRFKHWNQSNYAAMHLPQLYDLIMVPATRPTILSEGLPDAPEQQPSSTGPAVWLIAPGEGGELWQEFQRTGAVSIGWNDTGSLADLLTPEDFRDAVKTGHPDAGPVKVGRMLLDFARTMVPGDLVFAKLGTKATLGYGRVESDYIHNPNAKPFVHIRKVTWLDHRQCTMPEDVRLPVQTLSRIDRRPEVMEVLNEFYNLGPGPGPKPKPYTKQDALADLFMKPDRLDSIIELLKRKKNIILQGAPGTGKTFVARRLAYLLMGVADESRAPVVQFHQSTSYEDFIQGYRPDGKGGFELKDGTFYSFCQDAHAEPDRSFVFIIDEINRGNLSKIFGELMMLIESDKRDPSYAVPLTYAASRDETFHVPENVFLIGTMNTADRSLSLVDYALRRRFAFLETEPGFDSPVFAEVLSGHGASPALIQAIRTRMEALNQLIEADATNLGRGYRIGHSFFVPSAGTTPDDSWLEAVFRYEIIPLLEEYWADDRKSLAKALAIVNSGGTDEPVE